MRKVRSLFSWKSKANWRRWWRHDKQEVSAVVWMKMGCGHTQVAQCAFQQVSMLSSLPLTSLLSLLLFSPFLLCHFLFLVHPQCSCREDALEVCGENSHISVSSHGAVETKPGHFQVFVFTRQAQEPSAALLPWWVVEMIFLSWRGKSVRSLLQWSKRLVLMLECSTAQIQELTQ